MKSFQFFGNKIDNKLTLKDHVEGLCKKASQKVIAAARLSSLMRFEQRKRIVNLLITSHFFHCPLVWMFHRRRLNNRIDHIHESALKLFIKIIISLLKNYLEKTKPKLTKMFLSNAKKQKSICILKDLVDRSSHWKCSVRKGVLGNFTKFTGKHLCTASFLRKLHRTDIRHKYKKALYSTIYKYSLSF